MGLNAIEISFEESIESILADCPPGLLHLYSTTIWVEQSL